MNHLVTGLFLLISHYSIGQIPVEFDFDPDFKFRTLKDYWVIKEEPGKFSQDTVIKRVFSSSGKIKYELISARPKLTPDRGASFSVWSYDESDRISSKLIYHCESPNSDSIAYVEKHNYLYNDSGKLKHYFLQTAIRKREVSFPLPNFYDRKNIFTSQLGFGEVNKSAYSNEWKFMNGDGVFHSYDEKGRLMSSDHYRHDLNLQVASCTYKYNDSNQLTNKICDGLVPDSVNITYSDTSTREFGTYTNESAHYVMINDSVFYANGLLKRWRYSYRSQSNKEINDEPAYSWFSEERYFYDENQKLLTTEYYNDDGLTAIKHHFYRKN